MEFSCPTSYQVSQSGLVVVMRSLLKCPYCSVYDSSQPSKSISGLLNKAIKVFTTYKVDTTPFVNQAASAYTEVGWMTLY